MAFEYEYVFDVRCMVLDTLQYLQIKHDRKGGGGENHQKNLSSSVNFQNLLPQFSMSLLCISLQK